VLGAEPEIAAYYDATVRAAGAGLGKKVANWVINELLGRVKEPAALAAPGAKVPPEALAELVALVEGGALSGKLGKDVFAKMWATGRRAGDIVEAEGLAQVTDTGALEEACQRVVAAHPEEAARFKAGGGKLMGFFVGKVMAETGGKANPKAVNEILRRLLT
jgi:aspartyl-tRNA(Asn)/glutamyl-tRNA(Gln) amidotransferase subunit B